MRTLYSRLAWMATLVWILIPSQVLAAGGGGGDPIVFVADSRRFSGWLGWLTNLYNESRLYFTVLTVILIPVLALILGSIMNFLLARTGINLRSRAVADH